jgi:hypothetical protein
MFPELHGPKTERSANYRLALLPERAPHLTINTVSDQRKKMENLVMTPRYDPTQTDWPADRRP